MLIYTFHSRHFLQVERNQADVSSAVPEPNMFQVKGHLTLPDCLEVEDANGLNQEEPFRKIGGQMDKQRKVSLGIRNCVN